MYLMTLNITFVYLKWDTPTCYKLIAMEQGVCGLYIKCDGKRQEYVQSNFIKSNICLDFGWELINMWYYNSRYSYNAP